VAEEEVAAIEASEWESRDREEEEERVGEE